MACEVYRANTQIDVNARNLIKVKDFLMEFTLEREDEARKKAREKTQMMNAKMFFSCLTGVGMEALADGEQEKT